MQTGCNNYNFYSYSLKIKCSVYLLTATPNKLTFVLHNDALFLLLYLERWPVLSKVYDQKFMIGNYALVWSIGHDHNLWSHLRIAKASLNFDHSCLVLATIITIVNYGFKTFIVQATGWLLMILLTILLLIALEYPWLLLASIHGFC